MIIGAHCGQTVEAFENKLHKLIQNSNTIYKDKYEKETKREVKKIKKLKEFLNGYSGPEFCAYGSLVDGLRKIESVIRRKNWKL